MTATAWAVAAGTPDPELPMLTVADLGILRDVEQEGNAVVVTITPTYSGCPALGAMRDDLVRRLTAAGYTEVRVEVELSPAWSSDPVWATANGNESGILASLPSQNGTGRFKSDRRASSTASILL